VPFVSSLSTSMSMSVSAPRASSWVPARTVRVRWTRFVALFLATVCWTTPSVAEDFEARFGPGWLAAALRSTPERFGDALARPAERRTQVRVAVVVDGGPDGRPRWLVDTFRPDAEYFYPASAVKLAAAAAALAEMRAARAAGASSFGRDTPLVFEALPGISGAYARDPTAADGRVTLAWEVRKALVVSDNEAYNRLFEFAGHRAVNERLWRAGLPTARITHRFNVVRTPDQNRRSPAVRAVLEGRGRRGGAPFERPALLSDLVVPPLDQGGLDVGNAYIEPGGSARIEGPMSFREKCAMSLADLQRLLAAIVSPTLEVGIDRDALGLDEAERSFLRATLGEAPGALSPSRWGGPEFAEARFRPTLAGVQKVRPRPDLEVRGKAGRAYGFHVENAWYRDRRTGRAFFLAAAVYANEDGVLNDGRYEYGRVSEPFFTALGERVARAVFDAPGARRSRKP
jgi:hypothetical protein